MGIVHDLVGGLVAAPSGTAFVEECRRRIDGDAAIGDADRTAIDRLCALAQRLDELEYDSCHDALTGLYNRRGFDDQLAQALGRAARHGWGFGLVLLDLDGFKQVNDERGHHRGDAVLRAVGRRLDDELRVGDAAARLGGDEFAVIVHLDDRAELELVLARLGPRAAEQVTWTIGTAVCPDDTTSGDDLVRLADERLRAAKAATRRA